MILNRKRVRRGSIDFDLPEPVIEFDEFGHDDGDHALGAQLAHRLIEEFMLAANESVARTWRTRACRRCTASTRSPIPSG